MRLNVALSNMFTVIGLLAFYVAFWSGLSPVVLLVIMIGLLALLIGVAYRILEAMK